MNTYKVLQQWVNGTKHWTILKTRMSFDELWKSYKKTCASMGMKLIAMIPDKKI